MIGTILLCLTVVLIGIINEMALKRRKDYLSVMCDLSAECVEIMRNENKTVDSVLHSFSSPECTFLRKIDTKTMSDGVLLEQILSESGVVKDDIKVIVAFLSVLGCGDIQQQKSHCGYYHIKFEELLSKAENELNTKCKMQRSLYLLGSVALFIILI